MAVIFGALVSNLSDPKDALRWIVGFKFDRRGVLIG